tara:strand:+ start:957 stop:1709 length:753 start_codon:yes stop_codon:yes gene_type:complete
MSRDRALVQVNRTFPAPSPLVVLLQAAERIGWEGGHEAAERAPGQERGEDGRNGHEELAGRPAGEGCSAREEGVQVGSDERGSAFEIVDYRCKDAADRMRACLRRPSARQPPSEPMGELPSEPSAGAGERVGERVDEACSQETVVEDRGGAGVGAGVREPTPPLWEQVGRSWYAEERETTAETHAESAETHAEKMDITFLLRRDGGAQVDAVQDDVQREELEREIKRENKMLQKKVRALEAVVDYARCLS